MKNINCGQAPVQLYKHLAAKNVAYQVDDGKVPTEDEFTQWLSDLKHAVALKKIMIGG